MALLRVSPKSVIMRLCMSQRNVSITIPMHVIMYPGGFVLGAENTKGRYKKFGVGGILDYKNQVD
jgi:hypothetical protein